MASFEEALKQTLLGINKGFEVADADLHAEVAAAAQALGRITGGGITMLLSPLKESEKGAEYRLQIGGQGYEATLGVFLVSGVGYPIVFAEDWSRLAVGGGVQLADRSALASFFSSMASNPDSPLIRHLAFVLRRKKSSENGA